MKVYYRVVVLREGGDPELTRISVVSKTPKGTLRVLILPDGKKLHLMKEWVFARNYFPTVEEAVEQYLLELKETIERAEARAFELKSRLRKVHTLTEVWKDIESLDQAEGLSKT